MDLKTLLGAIKKDFDAAGIDFALIGGLAVGHLAYQRFTNDIDILVHQQDREKAKKLLQSKGYKIFAESEEFLQFQGTCPLDIQIARRPLSQKMLAEAFVLPESQVRCLRAEDLIGLKLQAFATNPKREFKEKADIQALIEVQGKTLDWKRIKEYADLFGKWPEIEAIRKRASADV